MRKLRAALLTPGMVLTGEHTGRVIRLDLWLWGDIRVTLDRGFPVFLKPDKLVTITGESYDRERDADSWRKSISDWAG